MFLKESERGFDLQNGIVLDVNSLYPYVMYSKCLPIGLPVPFNGKYRKSKNYPLYVQMIKCNFKLKDKYLPTIQLKNNFLFNPTDYITDSRGNDTVLTLTNIDLELFLSHYRVFNLEYLGGWKFQQASGLFKKYIDKWIGIKTSSKKSGNKAMYTLSKLMLNSLYGKFALNPNVRSNIPYLKEGIIHYRKSEKSIREAIYLPVGMFITSYARYHTITAGQKLYDRYIYADTDSLHLKGVDLPDLEIDNSELGKWKLEFVFDSARYLRAKTYIEHGKDPGDNNMIWKITAAGMPDRCYTKVNFENFKTGSRFTGKLTPKHVSGGIVLVDSEFTIRV